MRLLLPSLPGCETIEPGKPSKLLGRGAKPLKNWFHAIEVLGIFALMGSIPFVAWTKMTLGAVLTCAGTFLNPITNAGDLATGAGTIKLPGIKFSFNGGLKFLMVMGGVALMLSGAVQSKDSLAQEINRRIDDPAQETEIGPNDSQATPGSAQSIPNIQALEEKEKEPLPR